MARHEKASLLRATPVICADPAQQFCCTFGYHGANVSEACALGTCEDRPVCSFVAHLSFQNQCVAQEMEAMGPVQDVASG
jgi:hypothetical protein